MVTRENINGRLFLAQTTFYVYGTDKSVPDGEIPSVTTSSESYFEKLKNDAKDSIPLKSESNDESIKIALTKAEVEDIFKSKSDCYADTWKWVSICADGSSVMMEGAVIPAMTEEKFIEVVLDLWNKINREIEKENKFPVLSRWNKYETGNQETYPQKYDKYFVCRKDGKIHWETWNNSGWAYNNNAIIFWANIIKPL